MGVVLAPPALPLCIAPGDAMTAAVNPADIEPAVAGLAAFLAARQPSAVIVEHNLIPYMPEGKTPQAYAAIATAHEVCARLHERIVLLCRDRGIPLATLPRQAWAHRVVPGKGGGITDAQANAGLASHVESASFALLADQDQRDAVGALVGWILGPPKKKRRRRKKGDGAPKPEPTPEEVEERARKRELATPEGRLKRRAEKRCNCGPDGGPRPIGIKGRHPRTCPAAPPPAVRGSAEAAAAYVPMTR